MEIIFRGTLTKDKLLQLASEHLQYKGDDSVYNPEKNPDAISLTKQKDGNWIGKANKYGKVIDFRDTGPETVLKGLITHAG